MMTFLYVCLDRDWLEDRLVKPELLDLFHKYLKDGLERRFPSIEINLFYGDEYIVDHNAGDAFNSLVEHMFNVEFDRVLDYVLDNFGWVDFTKLAEIKEVVHASALANHVGWAMGRLESIKDAQDVPYPYSIRQELGAVVKAGNQLLQHIARLEKELENYA